MEEPEYPEPLPPLAEYPPQIPDGRAVVRLILAQAKILGEEEAGVFVEAMYSMAWQLGFFARKSDAALHLQQITSVVPPGGDDADAERSLRELLCKWATNDLEQAREAEARLAVEIFSGTVPPFGWRQYEESSLAEPGPRS